MEDPPSADDEGMDMPAIEAWDVAEVVGLRGHVEKRLDRAVWSGV